MAPPRYNNNRNLQQNNHNNVNQNNTNGQDNNNNNYNIFDTIAERTNNIEFINTLQLRQRTLNANIKTLGRREAILRETTVTFSHNKQGKELIEHLENNWVEKHEQAPLTYWQDIDHLYVQFPNLLTKLEFFELYASKPLEVIPLKEVSLLPANSITKQHISRKPVRCEISNVNPRISVNKINNVLNQTIHDGSKIISAREGKQHGNQLARSILFTVNANGLRRIICEMDGHIQYNQPNINVSTQLNIKVMCKPYQCRKCLKLGKHECQGEVCGNCGQKGHSARDCQSKRRFCNNCNKPGHRARDAHCLTYQAEIIRELRKMDIPVDYMTEKEKRAQLISILRYI